MKKSDQRSSFFILEKLFLKENLATDSWTQAPKERTGKANGFTIYEF